MAWMIVIRGRDTEIATESQWLMMLLLPSLLLLSTQNIASLVLIIICFAIVMTGKKGAMELTPLMMHHFLRLYNRSICLITSVIRAGSRRELQLLSAILQTAHQFTSDRGRSHYRLLNDLLLLNLSSGHYATAFIGLSPLWRILLWGGGMVGLLLLLSSVALMLLGCGGVCGVWGSPGRLLHVVGLEHGQRVKDSLCGILLLTCTVCGVMVAVRAWLIRKAFGGKFHYIFGFVLIYIRVIIAIDDLVMVARSTVRGHALLRKMIWSHFNQEWEKI